MIHSITTDKTNINFPSSWDEGSSDNRQEFTVTVDRMENTAGGFRYEFKDNEWFDVTVNGNTFVITARENFNVYGRTGYIILHHNCIQGEDGEITVYVEQDGIVCKIESSQSEVVFSSVLNNRTEPNTEELPDKKETVEIDVTVTGGDGKFFIKSFKEYRTVSNPSGSRNVLTANDNAVKVVKIGNSKVILTSYGRVSTENGRYYELILAHNSNPKVTASILIKYDEYNAVTEIPVEENRRSLVRKRGKSIRRHIPTFEETVISSGKFIESEINVIGLNTPVVSYTKNGRKRTKKADENIQFTSEGGTVEYAIDMKPETAEPYVRLSSGFVSYKIKKGRIILTAEPNTSEERRHCVMVIRHPYNLFVNLIKDIYQDGSTVRD